MKGRADVDGVDRSLPTAGDRISEEKSTTFFGTLR